MTIVMREPKIHQCECPDCEAGDASIQEQHQQFNVLMSRLDEQQRRWVAGWEAKRMGHGGTQRLHQITGLDINTIRRGRRELDVSLENRPSDRTRLAGGGRPRSEKKR
jgi:hypothetical protein